MRTFYFSTKEGKNGFLSRFQQLRSYMGKNSLLFTNSSKGVFQLQKDHRTPSTTPHICFINLTLVPANSSSEARNRNHYAVSYHVSFETAFSIKWYDKQWRVTFDLYERPSIESIWNTSLLEYIIYHLNIFFDNLVWCFKQFTSDNSMW